MPANTDHPCFIQPENNEVPIWRYMDFTKFMSLLETKSLFFSPANKFDDPFEGSIPKGNITHREEIFNKIPEKQREKAIADISEHRKRMTSHTYINCWHMSEHESAAMWKLYASTSEAIAICSKYSTLLNELDETTYLGKVHYIDYETAIIPENNTFWPFMFKRMSFAHENEIRAVIQDLEQKNKDNSGISMPIEPERLIEKVYISPSAPSWYFDLVEKVAERYELSAEVAQSSLSMQPIY